MASACSTVARRTPSRSSPAKTRASVTTGLPFTFVLLLMCYSLLKGIRHEYKLLTLLDKKQAGAA